jgi:hypothetical protein
MAAATPPQPPVDPAKAKLAAALFSGGAGPALGGASPAPTFAARHARQLDQQQQHAPPSQSQQQKQKPQDSVDLLGQLAPPPQSPLPATAGAQHDLLSQLASPAGPSAAMSFMAPTAGMPVVPTHTPQMRPPAAAASAASSADLFVLLAPVSPAPAHPPAPAGMQLVQQHATGAMANAAAGMPSLMGMGMTSPGVGYTRTQGGPLAQAQASVPPGVGMPVTPGPMMAAAPPMMSSHQMPSLQGQFFSPTAGAAPRAGAAARSPMDTSMLDQLLANPPPPAMSPHTQGSAAQQGKPDPFANLLS